MKILAIDPGAERLGWAVLEGDRSESIENKPPTLVETGVFGLKRQVNGSKKEPYQEYRLRLIDYWVKRAIDVLYAQQRDLPLHSPSVLVSEIVPVVGGGNFVVATQSQLASTAVTVLHTVARQHQIPVEQIGATTIKARIGGTKKATKVQVRNGCFTIMPELKEFKSDWTKIFEVPDAIATGLTYLGFDNRKRKN